MSHAADTDLDALAAQARSYPPLPLEEVAELLGSVRRQTDGPARTRLVEHHLGLVLDQAMARGRSGVEVTDLYQEGTLASIVAITEYAARSGTPDGLRSFVDRVVAVHLDATVEQAELARREEEAFVRDTQLFEAAEVALRHRLGRSATEAELAAVLEWPAERVEAVAAMLRLAREAYDSDIAAYLDDA